MTHEGSAGALVGFRIETSRITPEIRNVWVIVEQMV